jgi:hypothetical protein
MSKTVKLPENWDSIPVGRVPVNKGTYAVVVDDADVLEDGRIRIVYSILDEGQFYGWSLYETFSLDVEYSAAMFKEFLNILNIPQNLALDLSQCTKRTLRVVVKHRDDPETKQRFANVVRHLPNKQ